MALDTGLASAIKAGINGAHQDQVDELRIRQHLPNFIIIGAAKSATTTLTDILPRHPDCFISKPKEPKYFGRYYQNGWEWYGSRFAKGADKMARGEGSTMYASLLTTYRHTPELMHRYLPDAKLIYIVRHPLDRIVSQWRHLRGRDEKTADFNCLMRNAKLKKLVVGCSLYFQHLERFKAYYPDDQIHCLTFEDLIKKPKPTLKQLLRFLDLSPKVGKLLDDGALPKANEAGDKGRILIEKPEWPPKLRNRVIDYLRQDSEKMLAYMGKPLDFWAW
ncbi:sulfotransferase [Vulcanococcus sp. Clear-D1]|jgi:hypothetical protein|uniref:sulfotransferase family protein n=1 Tax=Vulcanococcus sp. Clear-D1 TaxID=2766970 RepID=UPI0019C065AD|nr:sulfotransferase [Vulcanococcus sp. Clear-D1]MBD1195012.1 sulfotransferase [Vulcanococcus sp. Clear-D1]